MDKGTRVWVIVPENTPAMMRVFDNQKKAEECFVAMLKEHGIGDCESAEAIEEVLDRGYFRGHSVDKNDKSTYEYTLNSVVVE